MRIRQRLCFLCWLWPVTVRWAEIMEKHFGGRFWSGLGPNPGAGVPSHRWQPVVNAARDLRRKGRHASTLYEAGCKPLVPLSLRIYNTLSDYLYFSLIAFSALKISPILP